MSCIFLLLKKIVGTVLMFNIELNQNMQVGKNLKFQQKKCHSTATDILF